MLFCYSIGEIKWKYLYNSNKIIAKLNKNKKKYEQILMLFTV